MLVVVLSKIRLFNLEHAFAFYRAAVPHLREITFDKNSLLFKVLIPVAPAVLIRGRAKGQKRRYGWLGENATSLGILLRAASLMGRGL